MKEEVMKVGGEPKPRRNSASDRNYEMFTRALNAARAEGDEYAWVHAASYTSNHGYTIKRAVERGEWDVPGGAEAWEIKIVNNVTWTGGGPGAGTRKVGSELWVRRKKKHTKHTKKKGAET